MDVWLQFQKGLEIVLPGSTANRAVLWLGLLTTFVAAIGQIQAAFATTFGKRRRLEEEKLKLEIQRLRLEILAKNPDSATVSASGARPADVRTQRIEWLLDRGPAGWFVVFVTDLVLLLVGGLFLAAAGGMFLVKELPMAGRLLAASLYLALATLLLRNLVSTFKVVVRRRAKKKL